MTRASVASLSLCVLLSACGAHAKKRAKYKTIASVSLPSNTLRADRGKESIFVLRSTRETQLDKPRGCAALRTGFEPYATDSERHYTFWAVETSARDGHVVHAGSTRVAVLRGCFGPTADRTRQLFCADIELGDLSFRGSGECVALALDVPERGLIAVRCHLVLSGLPPNYTGGLLTTNTLTSQEPFGGESKPTGYTQASVATIRLWRSPAARIPGDGARFG